MMSTVHELHLQVADRVRQVRLARGWSQAELAARAGVALPTYRVFEQSGAISLERLIRVSVALGRGADWEGLLAPQPPRTLDDVAATWRVRKRAGRARTARVDGSER